MPETPVTSAPLVAWYLSNLPAYRTGVSPLLRGVEIGLAHGFFLVGPFIKLGPLRNTDVADIVGCINGAALVLILTLALTAYSSTTFQQKVRGGWFGGADTAAAGCGGGATGIIVCGSPLFK